MANLCAQPAALGTPDDCCTVPPPPCELEFRTKAASATLCGLQEFVAASTPPKKYLKESWGGEIVWDAYSDSSCAAFAHQVTETFGGALTYSPGTCTPVDTRYGPGISATPCSALATSITRLNKSQTCAGGCDNCIGAPNKQKCSSCSAGIELQNEDTEDDAILRANSAIGSWTSCSADCRAFKELRGAGDFTLDYRTLQVRIHIPAGSAIAGELYIATLNLRRRTYGSSDPFVDWAELSYQFTGQAEVLDGPWLAVPVLSGDEVEVSSCYNIKQ